MSEQAPVQAVQAPVPQAPPQNGFHLQRKCACGSYSGGGGECDKCRKDRSTLQRVAVNRDPPTGVPAIVNDVLASSGQPLDAGTRSWMEPRFGHDFSSVRVHTDTGAAQSAQAVNALAYTVGRNVVFGAGQYAPGTDQGRQLLAHELTHVVQQDTTGGVTSQCSQVISHPSDRSEIEADAISARVVAGEPVAVREAPSAALHAQSLEEGLKIGAVAVGAGVAAGLITWGIYELVTYVSPAEKQRRIATAKADADGWVASALAKLNAFIGNPSLHTAEVDAARAGLNRHFHATDATTATTVRDRIAAIQAILNNWATMTIQVHDNSDLLCRDSGAYVSPNNPNQVTFCPKFFDGSRLWRAEALVHELAHTLTGGPSITDRGYSSDRVYRALNTAEALTNAESFALLVQDLGSTTQSTPGGPTDTGEDCPADWRALLDVAIARGQRWNRNAQVAVADRDPNWLTWLNPLLTQHLGAATPAVMDAAGSVYTSAANAIESAVSFECEPEGGGRCDGGTHTYWYGILSDFHICPSWKNIGGENDRIDSLLQGFYGYAAGVGDQAQRQRYARLARCITNTNSEWQTPGAAADPGC